MSNYNNLKTSIDANIKQNGNQEITGPILNSVLNQMVNILGTGYQFAGVAVLDTDPGTPDAKVFYIANGKGKYEKFGGLNVTEDDVVVLYWDSSWHKVSTGIASQEKLSELESEIGIFKKSHGPDYRKFIYELYITNMPDGDICFKNEPNSTRIICFVINSGVFARTEPVTQSNLFKLLEITVYSSTNTSYPVGTTVGYIIVKSIDGLAALGNYSQYNNINRQYCENINNSPTIAAILKSIIPSRIDDDSITTAKIANTNKIFKAGEHDRSGQICEVFIDKNITIHDKNYIKNGNGTLEMDFIGGGANVLSRYTGQLSNGIPLPMVVFNSQDAAFPVGKTIGYVVFNDYETFVLTNDGYNAFDNLNVDYCKDLHNSPLIADFLRTQPEPIPENEIKISVPDVIYGVVGDTLQLFYRGIFTCVNPYIYDINVICNIGSQYPRYYEVTPSSDNIGNHDITFTIKDNKNNVLGTKTVTLKVVSSGTSPLSQKNILIVGASCTAAGYFPSEFGRRLLGENGTPIGSHFSNIALVGRCGSGNGKYEATGGFNYSSYLSTSGLLHKFNFTSEKPFGTASVGDVYSFNGHNFTITEINITGGVGNISCVSDIISVYGAGTLTKVSGTGSNTLVFASSETSGNPFVYDGAINIQRYAQDYCNGQIDVVYTELACNGTGSYMTDFTSLFASMRQFINMFKNFNPNIKICIGTNWENDIYGGMGVNYGAAGGWSLRYGRTTTNHNMLDALQKYITENNLDDYVYIFNVLNEFDCECGFKRTQKPMCTRSQIEETFGVNGNHPIPNGYYQWADTAWRLFIAKFCQ